jgi:NNP family nitrate/nitrite transporter-like MFS transporter
MANSTNRFQSLDLSHLNVLHRRQQGAATQNSRQSYINLALAMAAFTVSFAAWSVISPLSHQIQTDFKLDNTAIGLLIAMPALLGALMRIPVGILTDRFGGRKVFTGLLLFILVPLVLLGFANSYVAYLVGGFFLGTAGASFAVGVPFVSRWFSRDRQGVALGIYGIGNIGTAATVFAMAPLVHTLGGRQGAMWFFMIPVALMAIVFWLFARDAPGLVEPQPLGTSIAALGRKPIAWHLGFFYFVTFGGFVFFANYLPQLLVDWFPSDRQDAGLQAAIFTMGATLSRPVGGWLADQLGGAKVLIWVFAFVVLTRLVLAWEAGNANIVIVTDLLFALALIFGFGNGAVFKLVAQFFPKNTGLAAGIVGAAGGLGGFFPPLIMGTVKDHTGSYALGFIILAALAGLCLALLLFNPQEAPAGDSASTPHLTDDTPGYPDGALTSQSALLSGPGIDGRARRGVRRAPSATRVLTQEGEDSETFQRLVNFLAYRRPVDPNALSVGAAADYLDAARNDARSIIAILEGRRSEDK